MCLSVFTAEVSKDTLFQTIDTLSKHISFGPIVQVSRNRSWVVRRNHNRAMLITISSRILHFCQITNQFIKTGLVSFDQSASVQLHIGNHRLGLIEVTSKMSDEKSGQPAKARTLSLKNWAKLNRKRVNSPR